ncbi:hypothetical protein BX616_009319, partial [Lobosporangium transversale]
QLREVLTEEAFDYLWGELLDDHKDDAKVVSYLETLHKRRSHWAGPWVKSSFTAGMRSTQRVEMTHNLIKSVGINSQTSLVDLFEVLSKTAGDEHFRYKMDLKVPDVTDSMIVKTFEQVLKMNSKYLTKYSMNEIRKEMGYSFGFSHQALDLQEVLQHVEISSRRM